MDAVLIITIIVSRHFNKSVVLGAFAHAMELIEIQSEIWRNLQSVSCWHMLDVYAVIRKKNETTSFF